eukprot:158635_1
MPSSVKQIRHKRNKSNNHFKVHKKKSNQQLQRQSNRVSMERKCIELFGSKKKSNKFIKQAIAKGNQIRTKTKHLRFDYQGYQLFMENNDTATNKKLALKALISIEYGGAKTAQRVSKQITHHTRTHQIGKSSNYPSLYPSHFQYNRSDDILILGEMDFSFAVDIAHNIGGAKVIATAYYSQKNAKKHAKMFVSIFEKLNGKQVLFDIDATSLHLDGATFDKILFGFPRNSHAPNSQKHNIIFMRKVFDEVEKCLNEGGQFQLLLHINKSGHSPLDQWKMEYPNWTCVHEQIFDQKQTKKMFSMYQSHDGKMNKWTPYRSGLYVFQQTIKFNSK